MVKQKRRRPKTLPPLPQVFREQLGADQPDLIVAILAASYLEALLGELLSRVLVSCADADGILRDAVNRKIRLAYALGLITQTTRDDLVAITEIRNHFAHHVLDRAAAFGDPEVTEKIRLLRPAVRERTWKKLTSYLGYGPRDPRAHFMEAVSDCAWELLRRPEDMPSVTMNPRPPSARPKSPLMQVLDELQRELDARLAQRLLSSDQR
jgi:hypothetical protein